MVWNFFPIKIFNFSPNRNALTRIRRSVHKQAKYTYTNYGAVLLALQRKISTLLRCSSSLQFLTFVGLFIYSKNSKNTIIIIIMMEGQKTFSGINTGLSIWQTLLRHRNWNLLKFSYRSYSLGGSAFAVVQISIDPSACRPSQVHYYEVSSFGSLEPALSMLFSMCHFAVISCR